MESKLHLDRLYVKNFRALDELTLEGLGRVNVFVGRNNSGKSTILDAIELLVSANKVDVLRAQSERHDEVGGEISPSDNDFTFIEDFFSGRCLPEAFGKILLESSKISVAVSHYFVHEKPIEITDDEDETKKIRTVRRLLSEQPRQDNANDENIYRAIALTVNGKRTILADNDDNHNQYMAVRRLSNSFEHSLGLTVRYVTTKTLLNSYLDNLWGATVQFDSEMNEILVSALQLVDSNVEVFGFMQLPALVERKPFIKLKGISKPVPLNSMGDGMSRVLHIILSLLNAKDGILLIDEMENGLHYRIQESLWRIIFEFSTKLNIQVFVTTHSWDVIESFSKIAVEHPEEGVLYSLGRSCIDEKLNAHRYSEERLYQVTQSEMEVR